MADKPETLFSLSAETCQKYFGKEGGSVGFIILIVVVFLICFCLMSSSIGGYYWYQRSKNTDKPSQTTTQ